MAQQEITVRAPSKTALYKRTFLETLDEMPFADYVKFFDGRIKSAHDTDRYDTLRIDGAATLQKGRYALFNVPRDGDAKTTNGTPYIKDKGDTNMVEGNKMEYGTILIVECIQVQLVATTREFATLQQGEPTDLTPAAAGNMSASNTVVGLADNIFLQFRVGDVIKAEGILSKFPCEYGFSGAIGGDTDEGFVQVGFGRRRPLKQIVVLKPGQYFTVELEVLRSLFVPQSAQIRVFLSGQQLGPVG